MKVLFPDRIINRHVGGNTTYAREIKAGLSERGIKTGTIPSGPHPLITMGLETLSGLIPQGSSVLHYSADTGPLLRSRTPSIVTVHGVASRWTQLARTPKQEARWRFRVQRAIECTDMVITVSESSADDISEVFSVPREDIKVIHHGIDSQSFATRAEISPQTAGKLPKNFALYLGNIEPRKNILELVRAFQTPEIKATGIPLVIAGKPAWNFEETMRAIDQAANVIYLGFVSDEDRIALMQRCTLFIFPSLYEGFGFPVLEAMAAGAPVATSRKGSLAEVAGPAWELDYLDASGLSHSLKQAMMDEAWQDSVKSAGRAWASQFTWAKSIDGHLDSYNRLVRQ